MSFGDARGTVGLGPSPVAAGLAGHGVEVAAGRGREVLADVLPHLRAAADVLVDAQAVRRAVGDRGDRRAAVVEVDLALGRVEVDRLLGET